MCISGYTTIGRFSLTRGYGVGMERLPPAIRWYRMATSYSRLGRLELLTQQPSGPPEISNDLLALAQASGSRRLQCAHGFRKKPTQFLAADYTFVISNTNKDARRARRRCDDLVVEPLPAIVKANATYRPGITAALRVPNFQH
jgi:hypothetical protein